MATVIEPVELPMSATPADERMFHGKHYGETPPSFALRDTPHTPKPMRNSRILAIVTSPPNPLTAYLFSIMPSAAESIVLVVGTGTSVGKTHVACELLRAFAEAKRTCLGLKPIESGYSTEAPDHKRLAATAGHPPRPPLYAFAAGVSPHLAARHAGIAIDLADIAEWCRTPPHPAVVETAGGLMTPLSSTTTNLDLATTLAPNSLLLVAPDALGVLHAVGAALYVLRHSGWARGLVIALSAPPEPDASTGSNADELRELHPGLEVVAFPRGAAAASTRAALVAALARVAPQSPS
jgi:dethiobiotin synthetase